MDELTFEVIAAAWRKIISDPDKLDNMKTEAPSLAHPDALRIRNINDDGTNIKLRFTNFDAATNDATQIPLIKRMIQNWIKRFSVDVRVIDSLDNDLNMVISKTMKFTEAAIPVFRRDPKTNKVKRAYKCIGGKKDGRRVSNPDQCLQYPNVAKKMSLSISRRAKYGQSTKARTKTKLTNIVARRVRSANARMKKARGL